MTLPRLDERELGHLGLRLVLGINMLVHGLVRVGSPSAFADGMVAGFEATPLPAPLVRAFALVLPFVELALGAALLLGVRLRATLFLGLVLTAMLTFDTCLQQRWDVAGSQLVYAIVYWILLFRLRDARLVLGRRPETSS